jgi:tetratricopeptide (TPR) repeat protein
MGRLAYGTLLVAAIAAVYGQVGRHEFVDFDDTRYIVENPRLREGLGAGGIVGDFTSPYYLNWHPLTSVSFRIDYALYGLEPAGYLWTNVALHGLAALALFLALCRMTGATGASAFVAGVFALHPLHVESVAWASSRKDVLSAVCFGFALLAYARYAEAPSAARMAAVAVALVVGLLSKAVLVTLPFVLLLLDGWPLRRLGEGGMDLRLLRARVAEKWPLFAVCLLAAGITWGVQREAGATALGDVLPIGLRVANAILSYADYLIDAVWPSGLAVFYPHPRLGPSAGKVACAGGALLAITGVALALRRRAPYLIVGWLWFLGMLVPMLGLVQVGQQARADRYSYLPLTGLAIAAAWSADALVRSPGHRRLLALTGAVVLVALGIAAWSQAALWRDSATLFAHARDVTSGNFKAHRGLGDALRRQGAYDEALREYAEATRIAPGWAEPYLGRAEVLVLVGRRDEAVASFERALELEPRRRGVARALGLLQARLGRTTAAQRYLEAAVAEGEADLQVLLALAEIGTTLGDDAAAAAHYRSALLLEPAHPAAGNNLAWLLATSADPRVRAPAEALRLAQQGVSRAPDHPGALDTLAAAFAASERFEDAVATAARALVLVPVGSSEAAEITERLASYRSGLALGK